jgi:hypothetical protein
MWNGREQAFSSVMQQLETTRSYVRPVVRGSKPLALMNFATPRAESNPRA